MARLLILTKEIIQQVAKLLPRALYIESVVAQLSISRETFRVWQILGTKEQRRRDKGQEPNPKYDLHCELIGTIKKALAEAETEYLQLIQAAGTQTWTALAWILERRFPDKWATNRGELRALAKQLAALNQSRDHAKPHRNTRSKDPKTRKKLDKSRVK